MSMSKKVEILVRSGANKTTPVMAEKIKNHKFNSVAHLFIHRAIPQDGAGWVITEFETGFLFYKDDTKTKVLEKLKNSTVTPEALWDMKEYHLKNFGALYTTEEFLKIIKNS